MNILDETVGAMNWERSHSRENANCTVRIWDDQRGIWVSKEDTGTESNTEKKKGLASDSFKRACFNWGIGRELYTSPFIWISANDCKITPGNGGKFACYDHFEVSGMNVENGKITFLTIRNANTKKQVFSFGKRSQNAEGESGEKNGKAPNLTKSAATEASAEKEETLTDYQQDELIDLADDCRVPIAEIVKAVGVNTLAEIPGKYFLKLKKALEKRLESGSE
ncbi:MAG: hypothetical protein MJZ76_06505 [Bacteroidales bacterium]|nr:hypothetical protein [Bacteroidales bacterium]